MPEILQLLHLGTHAHTHTSTPTQTQRVTGARARQVIARKRRLTASFGNLSPDYTQLAVARVPFDKLTRAKAKTNQLPNIAAHIAHTTRAPPPCTCCPFSLVYASFSYHLLLLLLLLLLPMYSMSSTPRRPLISCRPSGAAHAPRPLTAHSVHF